jgi:hypothetical protein
LEVNYLSKLIPIKYHDLNYPFPIKSNICEVPGNFDIDSISVDMPYSLHTEYSYGVRKFNSKIFKNLGGITSAQLDKLNLPDGIPQLWRDVDWAKDFFKFILKLTKNKPPKLLEIHPPYNYYCSSFKDFMKVFMIFYDKIKSKYSSLIIHIENRFGTEKKGCRFLLQYCSDFIKFFNLLRDYSVIDFKIVLDYPQLIGAETKMDFSKFNKITRFNENIKKKLYRFNRWFSYVG